MRLTTKQVRLVESNDRLKTKRIPLPGFPKPFDIKIGYTGTIWLTGERNAIGCLDNKRKLKVFPRTTGVRPHLLAQFWGPPSVPDGPSAGSIFCFTDPDGDVVGRIWMDGEMLPDIPIAAGSRPTAIFESSLKGVFVAAGNAAAIFRMVYDGSAEQLRCPHPRIDAAGWGPDHRIWYFSGTTLQGLYPERFVGGECELPAGARITELIAAGAGGFVDRLLYCDEGRDVIGLIENQDTVVEYELPAGVAPRVVTLGPSGYPWFVGRAGKSLFRLMGLTATEYRCADAAADLTRVVYSYDQLETFWFTERSADCVSSASVYGL